MISGNNRPGAEEALPPAGTRLPCVATRQDGQACRSFALPHGDQRCFRHSTVVSEERKRGASRLGGYAATSTPGELADYPAPTLASEADVRAAREAVFALTVRRLIPSPVAEVLKGLLQHQDEQIHRRKHRRLEREGLMVGTRVMVNLAPVFASLGAAAAPKPVAGTVHVLPAKSGE